MNKQYVLGGIIGLIIGLVIGFILANSLNREALQNQNIARNTPPQTDVQTGLPPDHANNLQTEGMLEDVQKSLDKARDEPDNYEAQLEAGRMYSRIQNFEKALEFFQKAQRIKPDDFEANAFLGNAFLDARQFENAETYYKKALELKPDNVTIRSDLASTFIERTNPDYERAFAEFNKALEIDPKHEPTIYNMGIAYLRKGEKQNAQKMLEKLMQASPESDLITKLKNLIDKS